MSLELASFPVNEMAFGSETNYRDGRLTINKEEILDLIQQDKRTAKGNVEIVHPGDQARIVSIRDVVEPRVKASGSGGVFPGILAPLQMVGEGTTHRLSGVAVISAAYYASKMRAGTASPNSSMLDMWGPGAAITPFASTHNLVLVLNLVDDLSEVDAHAVIQTAELTVAQRLAQTTLGLTPHHLEVFDLQALDSSLPKVVYILCCLSGSNRDFTLYGFPILESLPTLVHPTEFFDGAMAVTTRKGRNNHPLTWEWQNQPVVIKLCREHGKSLNFLGVILHRIAANTHMAKEVGALRCAQVARMMRAEAAIITRMNVSGNRFIDAMLTVEACEKAGIKAVFITPEYGGQNGEELPFPFTVPQADALISTGSQERYLELPAPKRVIGPLISGKVLLDMDQVQGRPPQPADVPLSLDGRDYIAGGIDWWGGNNYCCEEY